MKILEASGIYRENLSDICNNVARENITIAMNVNFIIVLLALLSSCFL
jgi:hypothetical protein